MIGIFLHHANSASLIPLTGDRSKDFAIVRDQILHSDTGSIERHYAAVDMSPDVARQVFRLEDDEVIDVAQALKGRGGRWDLWCDQDGMPKALPLNISVYNLCHGELAVVGNCVLVPAGGID